MSQRQRAGRGNLPAELTSFVGRARELAEVRPRPRPARASPPLAARSTGSSAASAQLAAGA